MQEIIRPAQPGIPYLLAFIVALLASIATLIYGIAEEDIGVTVAAILAIISFVICLAGFFMVAPNEGKVLQLFGDYRGTVKTPGLRWANPFYSKTSVSLRVRNFETGKLKVNDSHGNPIEIATVVVWRVVDTAEAVFRVDDYKNYVHVQSEAGLRNLAINYPYDAHSEGEISLSGDTSEVSKRLEVELRERLAKAGVHILEARISHLAYAQEIASAMLQRQQATAVVAARQKIVEGAVGMVESALAELSKQQILELDEERRAAMVSNLMVVLCSNSHTQPVINTGTLHA